MQPQGGINSLHRVACDPITGSPAAPDAGAVQRPSAFAQAFDAGHYEMMGSFVWLKTISLLKEQLVSLGMEFIGEMLGQSDFGPNASIDRVSEAELILLAEDLGIIRQTVAFRLRHTRELVNHFTGTQKDGDVETMAREEAMGCLRACAQGILARENINLLTGFIEFRTKLESQNLHREAPELGQLLASPYFFRRTILRALLSMLKNRTGAQLENAAANINVILPELWPTLGRPDRWHCGEAYAELHASDARIPVAALKKALTSVNGFDYVPEGIRAAAFMKAAGEVLAAHDGHNNYYNEPPAVQKLIALGSTIPPPAIYRCLSAMLSVELGHHCGHSWKAALLSRKFLTNLPRHRWEYYLSDCLPTDRIILGKLQTDAPRSRWIALVKALQLAEVLVKNPSVTMLLSASQENNNTQVSRIAERMNAQLATGE